MSAAAPERAPEPERTPEPSYGFLLYVGMAVGAAGAAGLYTLSKNGGEVSDLARYSAIGAVVCGVVLCYLSSLPKSEAIAWTRSGLSALAVAFAFRWAVGEPYRIPSGSMEPTLNGDERAFRGDRVWVNKWWYGWKWPFTNTRIFHLHEPQRWDIVVFNAVEKDAKHPVLVKRVVGLPGERIHIEKGMIHVNGEAIEVPDTMPPVFYTSSDTRMRYGVREDDEFAVVPPGHYLVCGDNSANSRDGRYFGWLPEDHIVGRVASVWWPLGHRRDFTGFSRTWWWRGSIALLLVWTVVRLFIGRSYPVNGPGGEGVDHYWVSFIAFGLRVPLWGRYLCWRRRPARGDLVLYELRGEGIPAGTTSFARVAGLPGETLGFVDGRCLINGEPLPQGAWQHSEAYSKGAPDNAPITPVATETPLGSDAYYLLCDDPQDAQPYDSRVLGPTMAGRIRGRMTRRRWPRNRAARL